MLWFVSPISTCRVILAHSSLATLPDQSTFTGQLPLERPELSLQTPTWIRYSETELSDITLHVIAAKEHTLKGHHLHSFPPLYTFIRHMVCMNVVFIYLFNITRKEKQNGSKCLTSTACKHSQGIFSIFLPWIELYIKSLSPLNQLFLNSRMLFSFFRGCVRNIWAPTPSFLGQKNGERRSSRRNEK